MSMTLEAPIAEDRLRDVPSRIPRANISRACAMGARARLYDALHDERKDIICTLTETGNGGYTHKFFKAPKNLKELVAGRDAIAEWAKLTYGWMGRAPDYKAAFLATLGGNPDFYKPFDENARRWYRKVNDGVTFVNHAIVNPPVDRNKALEDVRDVYMHVEKETDGGLIMSGAKVVANLDAHALQLHRQQRIVADQDQGLRLCLHRTERFARAEALLPAVL